MADPRAVTTRVGTEPEKRVTYKVDNSTITYDATLAGGSAMVGKAVYLSAAGIVALTNSGTQVLGRLDKVEADLFCAVLTQGVVLLAKGDAAIAVGDKIVGDVLSAARGYIRGVAATGAAYAEAAADDTQNGRHRVIDASVTTAVEVELGV